MTTRFKSSLFARIFATTTVALIVLFAVMYLMAVPFIQSTVGAIEENAGRTILNNVYEMVEQTHLDLENYRQSIVLERKAQLRNIIAVVEARAEILDKEVRSGKLSREQAKRTLLSELRHIKYGRNDYVFAADYRSVLISHPDPELNGADFSNKRDSRGNLIVPPMVEGARRAGEGYYSYWWRRLGEQQDIEKLSYYKHLPYFDLVLGTGVYLDDVEAAMRFKRSLAIEELRLEIHKTPIAKTGYLFIFDGQLNMLIHPNPNIEKKNVGHMLDPSSKKPLLPILMAAADQPEGARYKWDSPSDPGNYVYDKISWMRYFKEFDWYIGSSVYLDELATSARTLRNRVLAVFAITLLLSIGLIYLFVTKLTRPLRQLRDTALRVESGDLDARCTLNRLDEIGVVVAAFNGMVNRLQDNIQNLDAKVEERTAEREKADAERKEAETNLCESEDYNKMLFQESRQPMVVMDPLSGFIDCNSAAVDIYRFASRESVLGKSMLDVSAATQYDGSDSGTAAHSHMLAALEHGIDVFEWRHQRPNGEIWDAVVHLMSFNYRGLPLLQFTLEDITEKMKAEEERKELDRLKSDILSSVSHELRTPMTSVVGFAKIIKKKLEKSIFPLLGSDEKAARAVSQVRENLDIIVVESERLSLLINDVLDSAKLEAGKVEWDFVAVAPQRLIERSTAITSVLVEQKALRLISEIEPDLPDIRGDENRLLQVLINLIGNAVKFTEHGQITVRAERYGEFVRFSVRDSGCGIAEKDQGTVFDQFKQIGDTLTEKPHGTGLGLSICQRIIQHHGGEIWLNSELGMGSTFYMTVPIEKTAGSGDR